MTLYLVAETLLIRNECIRKWKIIKKELSSTKCTMKVKDCVPQQTKFSWTHERIALLIINILFFKFRNLKNNKIPIIPVGVFKYTQRLMHLYVEHLLM